MFPIILAVIGIATATAGAYALSRKPDGTGEIFAYGLLNVPVDATVEVIGGALVNALGWSSNMILDGVLTRTGTPTDILQFAFKGGVQTPHQPPIDFKFTVLGHEVTVDYVVKQPASTTGFSFP